MLRLPIAVVALFLGCTTSSLAGSETLSADSVRVPMPGPQGETYAALALFSDIFERVRKDYVDNVTATKLVDGAVKGMFKAAGLAVPVGDDVGCGAPPDNADRVHQLSTSTLLVCFGNKFE
jgi:hypothetical protein